jgi:hypothetical protein
MTSKAGDVQVDPGVKALFLKEFHTQRALFADTPTQQIRGAGRTTRAKPEGEDEAWWLVEGPKMLQRWHNWREQSGWVIWETPDGVPAIELELNVVHRGQQIKVIIDRVFVTEGGGLVIIDLKSGSRSQESDLQLGICAVAVEIAYGRKVVGGAYWDAREGTCGQIFPLRQYSPALIAHYAKQLQLARTCGIYLPHVTNMCRACGVREYCVAYGGKNMHLDPDYKYVVGDPETNGGTEHDDGS